MQQVDPLIVAIVFAVINLSAVYAAAFPYQLSWSAVLCVVVGMSVSMRLVNKAIFSERSSDLQKMLYGSAVALVSALLLLMLLSARFGFPIAFAIVFFNAVLHGVLNYMALL